jgi:hypothetical protein
MVMVSAARLVLPRREPAQLVIEVAALLADLAATGRR